MALRSRDSSQQNPFCSLPILAFLALGRETLIRCSLMLLDYSDPVRFVSILAFAL